MPQIIFIMDECDDLFIPNEICDSFCVEKLRQTLLGSICIEQSWKVDFDWLTHVWNPNVTSQVLTSEEKMGSGLENWEDRNMEKNIPLIWDMIQMLNVILYEECNCDTTNTDNDDDDAIDDGGNCDHDSKVICMASILSDNEIIRREIMSVAYEGITYSNSCNRHISIPISINFLKRNLNEKIEENENLSSVPLSASIPTMSSGSVSSSIEQQSSSEDFSNPSAAFDYSYWSEIEVLHDCDEDIDVRNIEKIIWPDGSFEWPVDRVVERRFEGLWSIDVFLHVIGIILVFGSTITVWKRRVRTGKTKVCLVSFKDCLVFAILSLIVLIINLCMLIIGMNINEMTCFLQSFIPMLENTTCIIYLFSSLRCFCSILTNKTLRKRPPCTIRKKLTYLSIITLGILVFRALSTSRDENNLWEVVEVPSETKELIFDEYCEFDNPVAWLSFISLVAVVSCFVLILSVDWMQNKWLLKTDRKLHFKVYYYTLSIAAFLLSFTILTCTQSHKNDEHTNAEVKFRLLVDILTRFILMGVLPLIIIWNEIAFVLKAGKKNRWREREARKQLIPTILFTTRSGLKSMIDKRYDVAKRIANNNDEERSLQMRLKQRQLMESVNQSRSAFSNYSSMSDPSHSSPSVCSAVKPSFLRVLERLDKGIKHYEEEKNVKSDNKEKEKENQEMPSRQVSYTLDNGRSFIIDQSPSPQPNENEMTKQIDMKSDPKFNNSSVECSVHDDDETSLSHPQMLSSSFMEFSDEPFSDEISGNELEKNYEVEKLKVNVCHIETRHTFVGNEGINNNNNNNNNKSLKSSNSGQLLSILRSERSYGSHNKNNKHTKNSILSSRSSNSASQLPNILKSGRSHEMSSNNNHHLSSNSQISYTISNNTFSSQSKVEMYGMGSAPIDQNSITNAFKIVDKNQLESRIDDSIQLVSYNSNENSHFHIIKEYDADAGNFERVGALSNGSDEAKSGSHLGVNLSGAVVGKRNPNHKIGSTVSEDTTRSSVNFTVNGDVYDEIDFCLNDSEDKENFVKKFVPLLWAQRNYVVDVLRRRINHTRKKWVDQKQRLVKVQDDLVNLLDRFEFISLKMRRIARQEGRKCRRNKVYAATSSVSKGTSNKSAK
eukprot:TRINITY_DN6312_c2_g1_i2.p1 TRINITY_DN6312_c2_g1~~TRINITY_DN6312_c2_g1_i2.p1  ORF type:complete len:1114 (+),score=232.77 TRINITY_DN6312_c2_g1_i2:72-3413(+)